MTDEKVGSSNEKENSKPDSSLPITFGVIFSIIVIGGFVLSLTLVDCPDSANAVGNAACKSKFQQLWESKPNEIGDAFAGFAGTLALLWLIVTAWMQRIELQAQRDELQKSRVAQAKMANAMDKQIDLLALERKIREQGDLSRQLNEILKSIIIKMANYQVKYRAVSEQNSGTPSQSLLISFSGSYTSEEQAFSEMKKTFKIVSQNTSNGDDRFVRFRIDSLSKGALPILSDIKRLIGSIVEMTPELSGADQERVRRLSIQEISNDLDDLFRVIDQCTA